MIFGAPDSSPDHLDAEGMRVAVVGTEWNAEVVDMLTKRAVETAEAAGAEVQIFTVSGAMELPLMAQAAAKRFDAVVALGCVIRGETPHFDYVCDAATRGITDVAVRTRTPIGFGVLTCDDDAQALDRAGLEGSHEDKGHEAAQAAVATFTALSAVTASRPTQALRA